MLSQNQISSFNRDGYLVVEDFLDKEQRELIINRAQDMIEDFDPATSSSIFTTNEQERASDEYFLKSGDQIRFFFEEKAIDRKGNFTVPKQQSINKIGHAQHALDPVYKKVINSLDIPSMGKQLGIVKPRQLQSMHIFKQPNIGGEVVLHQINPGKLTAFIWSIQIAITPKIIGYNLKYNCINSMLKYER